MGVFNPEGKGEPIPFSPIAHAENGKFHAGYDFKAILGSQRYHLGSGTRTSHSARIRGLESNGEVELAPEDGAELGLEDGDIVRISSPSGSIAREVKVNRNLVQGLIFVPVAFHNNDALQLIELTRLNKAGLKACQVKIEKQ